MTATENRTAPAHLREGRRNEKVGKVVSTKMAKTVVVEVELHSAHALYRRGITSHRRFYAHDEQGACHVGDTVRITETRPLSKLKRWRLLEVVRRASTAPSAAEIAKAVGQGELDRDTRRPKPAAHAPEAQE
ncbi:MAG TPA: 30S ribosomal protein S17 [Terriglobales bacterium]|nr:30S ribosomal protein S17 [Terriglobales bacterium]